MNVPPTHAWRQTPRPGLVTAISFLVATLLHAPSAWGEPLIAIVTATRGNVSVREGTRWNGAVLMHRLRQGALIRVADGATTTLGFVQGGVRVYLQGPCEVEVVSSHVRVVQGTAAQVRRTEPPTRAALRLPPMDSSLDTMGAAPPLPPLPGPAKTPMTAMTWVGVNQAYLTAPAGFAWRLPPEAKWTPFHLSIWRVPNGPPAKVKTADTAHAAQVPSTVRFEAGQAYRVQIVGVSTKRGRVLSPTRDFRVLALDEANTIRQAQEEAELEWRENPTDPTPLVILLARLDAAGLTREALDVAQRLEKLQGPPSPELAERIQSLRHTLGR